MKNVDFGLTSGDYATFRVGFPESLYQRLAEFDIGNPGQEIVDLGTGTGTLARGFAKRGCSVIGIDPSAKMLAQARKLDHEAGVKVEYKQAKGENTGLPNTSFDVVTAGQCWHWFERPTAAKETARILRPDGTLMIAHYDWLPLKGNVVARTEDLILKYNPAWDMSGGTGLYPQWVEDLEKAGYQDINSFWYDEPAVYTPEAWRGRIRASAGVGATLSDEQVIGFDEEMKLMLSTEFSGDVLQVPHRVFAVMAKTAI